MTEHNRMTAEQKSDAFHKFCKEKGYPENEKSIGEMAYEFAEYFALQVATEAVEKEIDEYKHRSPEWINAKYLGHYILETIKNRLK